MITVRCHASAERALDQDYETVMATWQPLFEAKARRILPGKVEFKWYHHSRSYGNNKVTVDVPESVSKRSTEVGRAFKAVAKKLKKPIVEEQGTVRIYVKRRGKSYPTAEETYAPAPELAEEKEGPGFAKVWAKATKRKRKKT